MRVLLCSCFGQGSQHPQQKTGLHQGESQVTESQPQELEFTERLASAAFQTISALRARLACTKSPSWAAKLSESAVIIADVCDAGLAGLLGLTTSDGESALVVLATGGHAAAALGIGEILPWDPDFKDIFTESRAKVPPGPHAPPARQRPPHYLLSQLPPMPLPPWEPAPCLRHVGLHVAANSGSGKMNSSGLAQEGVVEGTASGGSTTAAAAAATARAEAKPPLSSVLRLEPWMRVLKPLQHALPDSGPARSHMVLLPLGLGGQHVGALLLALPVALADGTAGSSDVFANSLSRCADEEKHGGKQQQQQQRESLATTAAEVSIQLAPAALRKELLQNELLLAALATCVSECCLAPVLAEVQQVCSSCTLLDTSTTLQELSTCITSTLLKALSSELHVELGVRLALLPSKDSPQGVLFEDPTRIRVGVTAAGSTGLSSVITVGTQASAASLLRSAAIPFLAVHRASGQMPPQFPGSPRSTGRETMASGASGYSTSQMRTATTTLSSDDVLCAVPLTHGSVHLSHLGATTTTTTSGISSAPMKRCVAASTGGPPSFSANRRVLSPVTSSNSRQIRASILSTASTLAAALLSDGALAAAGTASTNDGTSSSGTVGGRVSAPSARLMSPDIAGGGGVYSSRIVGAVIPNVTSFLQDTEQPTSDVFAVLRRSGINQMSASLVAVAAWFSARSTGSGAVAAGSSRSPTYAYAECRMSSLRQQQQHRSHGGPLCNTAVDARSSGASIGMGGAASAVNTSCMGSAHPRALDGSVASSGAMSPPAFVFYFTSTMLLPPQLLCAIRDRAMGLLEVLLPTAARVLASSVLDEWSCLSAQVNSGAANGGSGLLGSLGPFSGVAAASPGATAVAELPRSCSLVATGHGMTGSGHAMVGGSRALAALSPLRRGVSGPKESEKQLLQQPVRNAATETGIREGGSSNAAIERQRSAAESLLSAGALQTGSRVRQPFGTATGLTGSPAAQRLEMEACHTLETFPSSSGIFGLEDDAASIGAAGVSGIGGGAVGPAAALLLSTVLSDGRETAKSVRQAQLDIMVSTYHNALNKARHDAGGLGGLHAEDDVRNVRLIKTIGTGGCSVVFLARLHSMPVAVKVILPPTDDSEEEDKEDGDASPDHFGAQGSRKKAGSSQVDHDQLQEDDDDHLVVLPPSETVPLTGTSGSGKQALAPSRRSPNRDPASVSGSSSAALGSRASRAARQVQMRLLMRGARELAVMTSISHPNIVQVYSYCTRVVIQEMASGLPKLEAVSEGTNVKDPFCTALIMEYCDMGSLADAIDSGAFARAARAAASALNTIGSKARQAQSVAVDRTDRNALGNAVAAVLASSEMSRGLKGTGVFRSGSIVQAPPAVPLEAAATAGTPSMRAIYLTLLEVALALRHLHSLSLVHSDVKPANVLLRSSATDPRGFTAKLTDFGFVNLIEQRPSNCGRFKDALAGGSGGDGGCNSVSGSGRGAGGSVKLAEPVGTVTHMAPELFIHGHRVDSSIDIYAFGILMWELSTGRAPYPEYAERQFLDVPYKVVKEGLRPRFPSDTPLHYKLLAQECWASQPNRRPTAASLVSRLQRLLDLSCGNIPCPEAEDIASSRAPKRGGNC